jgi:spore coat protein CotH
LGYKGGAIAFILTAIIILVFNLKSFKKDVMIISTITDAGVIIEKEKKTTFILKNGVNMCNIHDGKLTDDITIHKSTWTTTDDDGSKTINTYEVCVEGVQKSDIKVVSGYLKGHFLK